MIARLFTHKNPGKNTLRPHFDALLSLTREATR
jgi:hypothetical protein